MEEAYYARTKVWPIMHIIAIARMCSTPIPGSRAISSMPSSNRNAAASSACSIPRFSRYPLAWLPTYARKMRDLFERRPVSLRHRGKPPDAGAVPALHPRAGIAHRHAKPEEIFPKGIMTSSRCNPRLRALPRAQIAHFPLAAAGAAGFALQPGIRCRSSRSLRENRGKYGHPGRSPCERRDGPRAPVFGFSQGMLMSLPPLVRTSLTAARAMTRSPSAGGSGTGFAAFWRDAPVCSASPFFANTLSIW